MISTLSIRQNYNIYANRLPYKSDVFCHYFLSAETADLFVLFIQKACGVHAFCNAILLFPASDPVHDRSSDRQEDILRYFIRSEKAEILYFIRLYGQCAGIVMTFIYDIDVGCHITVRICKVHVFSGIDTKQRQFTGNDARFFQKFPSGCVFRIFIQFYGTARICPVMCILSLFQQ